MNHKTSIFCLLSFFTLNNFCSKIPIFKCIFPYEFSLKDRNYSDPFDFLDVCNNAFPLITFLSEARWAINQQNRKSEDSSKYPLTPMQTLIATGLALKTHRLVYQMNRSYSGCGASINGGNMARGLISFGATSLGSLIGYGIIAYGYRKEWKNRQNTSPDKNKQNI